MVPLIMDGDGKMKKDWEEIVSLLQKVKDSRPLVHMIPNQVTAAFMADAVVAVGARPIMAYARQEFHEITSHANALVVNLGQLDERKIAAAREAIRIAHNKQIPTVLDPVGVSASKYRKLAAKELMSESWRGIIKGNSSELHTLQTGTLFYQGVDCLQTQPVLLPTEEGRVWVMTGKEDLILSNEKKICLTNKKQLSYPIVGMGCVAGALCGVFAAVTNDDVVASLCAMSILGVASERSASNTGYGTYKQRILDVLSTVTTKDLVEYMEKHYEER